MAIRGCLNLLVCLLPDVYVLCVLSKVGKPSTIYFMKFNLPHHGQSLKITAASHATLLLVNLLNHRSFGTPCCLCHGPSMCDEDTIIT